MVALSPEVARTNAMLDYPDQWYLGLFLPKSTEMIDLDEHGKHALDCCQPLLHGVRLLASDRTIFAYCDHQASDCPWSTDTLMRRSKLAQNMRHTGALIAQRVGAIPATEYQPASHDAVQRIHSQLCRVGGEPFDVRYIDLLLGLHGCHWTMADVGRTYVDTPHGPELQFSAGLFFRWGHNGHGVLLPMEK